ncbi:MAG: hydrogenase maturation protease [Peptococcaceae bacterium]|nr:hydrogenase maturation protease [Peptococcaceae bacterium]
MAEAKIRILGCGNIIAGDDGVGVEVLHELQKRTLPAGVELVEAGAPGLGMLDLMYGARKVIIVDAVADGGPAGRVIRWREAELPKKTSRAVSVHDISIRDALAFGRKSVPAMMPDEIVVIGITVERMEKWHMGLSPAVVEAVPAAVEAVMKEIERWVGQDRRD